MPGKIDKIHMGDMIESFSIDILCKCSYGIHKLADDDVYRQPHRQLGAL